MKKKFASCSGAPQEAYIWVSEIGDAEHDDFADSGDFEKLDAKIATDFGEAPHGEAQCRIHVLEKQTMFLMDPVQT